MKAYALKAGAGIEGLTQVSQESPKPGPGQVVVGVRAVSLNYRDLMVAAGHYPGALDRPLVPCSDGAGEVLAVGAGVTRVKPGDRVAASFFPDWHGGDPSMAKIAASLGGSADGMLAEQVLLSEQALVHIPEHLDFVEAACLPCAGVTAWNAMFETGDLKPGDTVLLQGTGGVSVWALQMAVAAGLRVIMTSSSDEKLDRVRGMGAHETINYAATPEWQDEAMRLTGGRGVDLVVEVGGEGTLARSMAAVRMRGLVSVIGGLSGFAGGLGPMSLIFGAKQVAGIYVGSRDMFENLNRFVALKGIKPVVDKVFDFAQAQDAYRHMAGAKHFGKVVIRVA
jgi:NADPH:quinone reductase-like Zn-dependent oxidoreductase